MRRKLLLAMSTAAVTVASLVATAGSAQAHKRHGTCVVAVPGARLFPLYSSGCHACSRPPAPRWVQPGRAFRVDRHDGGYLQVWHLQARGWIEYRCVRIVPEDYCIAAGI